MATPQQVQSFAMEAASILCEFERHALQVGRQVHKMQQEATAYRRELVAALQQSGDVSVFMEDGSLLTGAVYRDFRGHSPDGLPRFLVQLPRGREVVVQRSRRGIPFSIVPDVACRFQYV